MSFSTPAVWDVLHVYLEVRVLLIRKILGVTLPALLRYLHIVLRIESFELMVYSVSYQFYTLEECVYVNICCNGQTAYQWSKLGLRSLGCSSARLFASRTTMADVNFVHLSLFSPLLSASVKPSRTIYAGSTPLVVLAPYHWSFHHSPARS
jgi:hypothetical protein